VDGAQVGTVGSVVLDPNLVNVVAGRATFTVDLRNTDDEALVGAEAAVAERIAGIAARAGLSVRSRTLARFAPVAFDRGLVARVETTAAALGLPSRRMPSGAGHDAQMMARVCPAAMIFVPSAGGLSHNIAEYTAPDDLAAGASVLLELAVRLAGAEVVGESVS